MASPCRTRGRAWCCKPPGSPRKRRPAASIGAGASAGRSSACSCISMRRRTRGLPDLPSHDLVVTLDDADGRIPDARLVPQEGTASTFAALHHLLTRYGRFAELYTDRGRHFGRTPVAGGDPSRRARSVARCMRSASARSLRAPPKPAAAANARWHDPRPPAPGAAPRGRAHVCGRQRVPHRRLRARLQSPLQRAPHAARVRVHAAAQPRPSVKDPVTRAPFDLVKVTPLRVGPTIGRWRLARQRRRASV
jgi:hypothetical protein